MKTIILGAAAMLAVATCDARMHHSSGTVPNAVEQSFTKQYPQQMVKKWEMKHDTCIAEFTMDKRKQSAYFFDNGQWIKTETKLPWTKDLPVAVKETYNQSRYGSWRIERISEVKTPANDVYTMVVFYDCGPEGSVPGDCVRKQKLYFNADGSMYRNRKME